MYFHSEGLVQMDESAGAELGIEVHPQQQQ